MIDAGLRNAAVERASYGLAHLPQLKIDTCGRVPGRQCQRYKIERIQPGHHCRPLAFTLAALQEFEADRRKHDHGTTKDLGVDEASEFAARVPQHADPE